MYFMFLPAPKSPVSAAIAIFAIGLLIACGVAAKWATTPLEGDGELYTSLGQSLATGHGYSFLSSQDSPSTERLPGLPFLLATVFKLFPGRDPNVLSRFLCAFLHAYGAAATFVFAFLLCRQIVAASIAGLIYATSPTGLYLVAFGLSETAFIALLMTGLILLLARRLAPLGAFLLGAGVLFRANFIIFPILVLAISLFSTGGRRALLREGFGRICVLCLLFWCVPAAWILRNYTLSGGFPVLATIEGETFYGGNNVVVATNLDAWGYWIFPDVIPGETPKLQLKRHLSDLQVSRYYHRKGIDYIRRNWFSFPRLLFGKFVRAFAPIPWVPSVAGYVSNFVRGIVDLLIVIGALFWWSKLDGRYQCILASVFVLNVITLVVYYGSTRFTYSLVEVFCLPLLAVSFGEAYSAWTERTLSFRRGKAAVTSGQSMAERVDGADL
jgi:hypothetical protein